jgi:hypothetical protein
LFLLYLSIVLLSITLFILNIFSFSLLILYSAAFLFFPLSICCFLILLPLLFITLFIITTFFYCIALLLSYLITYYIFYYIYHIAYFIIILLYPLLSIAIFKQCHLKVKSEIFFLSFIIIVIPDALAPYLVSPALVAGLRGTRNLPIALYYEIAASPIKTFGDRLRPQ